MSIYHMLTKRLLPILLLLLLVACSDEPAAGLNGRISVWHSWTPEESAVLEAALAEFEEIHPAVTVDAVGLDEEDLLDEFYRAGENGLGPGLLIGDNAWLTQLADDGLIRPIDSDPTAADVFNLRNRTLADYQDQTFSAPLNLRPNALFYNTDLVARPPDTLDDLLAEAEAGNRVAFVPRFQEAFWGIGAFGDGLVDDEGRLVPADSGLEQWLTWLAQAQSEPGIILNVDNESLLALFAAGELAYFVASPDELAEINARQSETDPIAFSVVPLPSGPGGPAAPTLSAESIFLYAYTSAEQSRIAETLAQFLVNNQQSIRFMRELQHVPSNSAVRVDRRIYPIVSGFSRQADTAVVFPNNLPLDPVIAAGDRAYVSALSGALTPEQAVCVFAIEVAAIDNLPFTEVVIPDWCDSPSELPP